MTLESLTGFFGWLTIINIAILSVSTLVLVLFKHSVSQIHRKLFDLDQADLNRAWFNYLALYKIAIIIFNLTPYIALKIII